MSKMSANVNRQYAELKKLIVGNTQQPRMGNPVQSSTVSRGPLVAPPFRSFDIGDSLRRGKRDDARKATADESVSWIPCMLGLRNPRTCETRLSN